ncbi:hypothetical protein DFH09DRAFT_1435751 [Mycena vulgaris]|nr:hypothetical protein DFH09DRAFT_1435751 [Mycena vulgaris]
MQGYVLEFHGACRRCVLAKQSEINMNLVCCPLPAAPALRTSELLILDTIANRLMMIHDTSLLTREFPGYFRVARGRVLMMGIPGDDYSLDAYLYLRQLPVNFSCPAPRAPNVFSPPVSAGYSTPLVPHLLRSHPQSSIPLRASVVAARRLYATRDQGVQKQAFHPVECLHLLFFSPPRWPPFRSCPLTLSAPAQVQSNGAISQQP